MVVDERARHGVAHIVLLPAALVEDAGRARAPRPEAIVHGVHVLGAHHAHVVARGEALVRDVVAAPVGDRRVLRVRTPRTQSSYARSQAAIMTFGGSPGIRVGSLHT